MIKTVNIQAQELSSFFVFTDKTGVRRAFHYSEIKSLPMPVEHDGKSYSHTVSIPVDIVDNKPVMKVYPIKTYIRKGRTNYDIYNHRIKSVDIVDEVSTLEEENNFI